MDGVAAVTATAVADEDDEDDDDEEEVAVTVGVVVAAFVEVADAEYDVIGFELWVRLWVGLVVGKYDDEPETPGVAEEEEEVEAAVTLAVDGVIMMGMTCDDCFTPSIIVCLFL